MVLKCLYPINSLAPGKFEFNLRWVILKLILMIDCWVISCEIAVRWMSFDLTDDKSTLAPVMAWCIQATSHCLSQCWPRSMSPYGITRPQWVKLLVNICVETLLHVVLMADTGTMGESYQHSPNSKTYSVHPIWQILVTIVHPLAHVNQNKTTGASFYKINFVFWLKYNWNLTIYITLVPVILRHWSGFLKINSHGMVGCKSLFINVSAILLQGYLQGWYFGGYLCIDNNVIVSMLLS